MPTDSVDAGVTSASFATSAAQALLDSSAEAVVIADREGRIVFANRRAEAMFGYAPGELVGQSVEGLLPERLRTAHVGHRARYFETPRPRPMGLGLELTGRRKDGSEFAVEIGLSSFSTPDGTFALSLISDISERKRTQEAVERAARQAEKLAALGTLSAGIAHEFNNPISIITSRIELMLMDADAHQLPDEVRQDLHVLHQHAQRVSQIARWLLSFARQSTGELRPLDLSQLVEQTLLFMQKQIAKEGIEVRTALDRGLPSMVGDANALQQVVVNLLTNAREAIDGRGEIRIQTGPAPGDPSRIRLVVSDTGSGIPPHEVPRIFDPFYTTKPRGTGLGLSVSYGIVQDHQGTIEVESEVGRGTTFVISFPTTR